MDKYVVVGGNYTDTNFNKIAGKLESYGPFVSYGEAYTKWQTEAWKNVDDCHNRFMINTVKA